MIFDLFDVVFWAALSFLAGVGLAKHFMIANELVKIWGGLCAWAFSVVVGVQLQQVELVAAIVLHFLGMIAAVVTISYTVFCWRRALLSPPKDGG